MPQMIMGYAVSNTNGSAQGKQLPCVSVRNPSGQLAARVYGKSGRVLERIRRNLHCDERKELIKQLREVEVPEEVIREIVALTPKGN